MNDFSPEEYLASRLQEELAATGQLSGSAHTETKHDRVAQASQSKVQALEARLQERLQNAQKSYVGRMGLDPDSLAGAGVNLFAVARTGLLRAGQHLASAPFNLLSQVQYGAMDDATKQAYARYQQGQASEADMGLLNQQQDLLTTNLEGLQRADAQREIANSIAGWVKKETDGIMHTGDRRRQERDFREQAAPAVETLTQANEAYQRGDYLEGAGKAFAGAADLAGEAVQAAVTHPQASLEFAVENTPQLALGAVSPAALAASNVGYAADTLREGINAVEKKTGQLPSDTQFNEMALRAGSLAAAEHFMDTATLKAMKSPASAQATRRATIDQLLGRPAASAARIAGATGVAGVGEMGTEMFQTYQEGQIKQDPASGMDVAYGGMAGLAAGGGMTAPVAAIQELAERQQEAAVKEEEQALATERLGELVQAKDPESQGTATEILRRQIEDPRTEPEQLNASLGHLDTLRSTLESQLEQATPEALEQAQTKYDRRMGQLDQIQTQMEAQPDDEGKIQQLTTLAEKRLQFQAEWEAAQALPNQREQLQANLEKVTELQNLAQQKTAAAPTTLKADLELADRAVTELDEAGVAESQAAGERLVTLAMRSPEYLPAETAQQLADNSGNGLSDMQRTVLRRFAEAKALAHQVKGLSGVRSDIFQGNDREGYKGLDQYQADIGQALSRSKPDFARVRSELGQLQKFAESRLAKQQVIAQAFARVKNGGEEQWLPSKQGWVKADRRYSRQEMYEMGGLTVHKGSQALAEAVKLETQAVRASLASLRTQAEMVRQKVVAQRQAQQAPVQASVPTPTPVQTEQPAQPAETPVTEAAPEPAPAPTASTPEAEPQANAEEGAEPASREEDTPTETESLDAQLKTALASSQEIEMEETEADQPAVDGTLSLYAEPSLVRAEGQDINEWFQQANLIREWYEQRSGARDSDDVLVPVKGRPLVLEADFLSAWEADSQLPFSYLPEHFQQASEDARGALIQFQRLVREWQPTILESLDPDFDDAFRYTDPFYYLTNREEDGSLSVDENLVTAMTLAGAGWLAERAASGTFSAPREINGLLGRDSKHPIKAQEWTLLADKGVYEPLVFNAMGQRLLDALGLKASKAPDDFKARLTASAGAHVAAVLLKQGLLQRVSVSFAELRKNGIELGEMRPDPQTGELKVQKGGLTFLRPAVDFQTRVLERNGRRKEVSRPEFQAAVDNTTGIFRNSGNILGALFGVENALREPDQTVPERKAKNTNNTRQNEPAKLTKTLAEDVKRPWQVRWDMANLLDQLSPTILERIVGIEVDLERVPKMLRKGVQAKNDALRRDLDNARRYLTKLRNTELGEDTLLYMPRSVWSLHRVGMDGNLLNAMASKIHRHLVGMQAWRVEVDPRGDLDGVLSQFKMAVMEGLGTKTDKQSNAKTIEQFDTWYQQDDTQQLLDALVRAQWQGEPLTAAEQHLLLKMTQQGGEKLFSADALLNAAEYHRALTQGGTFRTDFFREVDGKTNGSMLAHLQLMPFSNLDEAFAFLRRGGFYRKGDTYRHYSEFRSDGSQPDNVDIYEAVVRSVYQGISRVMAARPQLTPQFGALWNFIGHPLKDPKDENSDVSSDGRNLVKTPTTGVVYGSGMGGTLNGMKAEFQEKIFVRLHKLATGQAKKGDSVQQWLYDLNVLLAANKAPIVKLPADIDQLLELELTPKQLKALDQAYGRLMYLPVKQAMEQHFGKFMERRNLVNRATRVLFHLYDAAYGALKQAEIDRLMAAGELPFYVDKAGNKVPRHDLLAEQEQAIQERLKELFPAVHSPFSAGSNDPSQAIPMVKSERSLSEDPAFKGRAKFSEGFVTTADGKRSSNSLTFAGFQRLLTNPGVAGMVKLNQSGDSAVSADAYAKLPALNVHDAHGLGLADAEQGAKNLNQATFEVMASYSMLEQVEMALSQGLQGFQSLLQDPELGSLLTHKQLQGLAEEFSREGHQVADHKQDTLLQDFMIQLRAVRLQAEDLQLRLFEELASVDQYSMEGGAYQPDAAVVAQLALQRQQRLEQLEPVVDARALDALLIEGQQAPADTVKKVAEESDRFEEIDGPVEQPARPTTAAWGELGQSEVAHDAELVAFFEQNPRPSLRDTVKVLRGRIEALPAGRTQNYYRELWKQLMQSLGNGVSIEYVTEATALPQGLEPKKANSARGLYAFNARSGRLYIKSPAFRHSGITTEMLLHELTHIAIARLLDQAEQGQASAEVMELKDDLQRLYDRAREFTEKEGTAEQWAIQLENLQEFVAWGMTNPAFQRDVLNRFSVASKTGKNRLVVAAKAFIERLRDLLFAGSNKSRQQIQVQALTQLLRNVRGLMQAVQEQRENAPVEGPLKVLAYEDGDGYLDIDDLFDALGDGQPALAPTETSRLKDVLDSVVKPLHGPFGAFRLQVLKSQQGDAAQQFLAAKLAGEAPLASRLQTAAGLNDQLAFVAEQVEVTVRTALDTQDRSASLLARELKGLYNEVVQRVGNDLSHFYAGDWNQATAQEQAQARALKEAFLGIPEGAGPSDYLSRFAALGLSHPLLNRLLQAPTSRQTLDLRGLTLWEKLGEVVARLARLVAGKLTNTWAGQAGDAKLGALVRQLVLIETRHRERLARPRNQWLEQLEGALEQVSERGRQAAIRALDSDLVKGSRFTTVRVLGKVAGLAGQERADQILASTLKLRERMFSGHYGFVAGMANEMKGAASQFMALLRLAKHNEQHRKHLDSWTRQQVLESFANKGKSLGDLDRQALGYLLRTDVADLFDQGLSLEELRTLLLKDNDLQQRIDQLSQQLMALPQGAMYVRRAKALGVFMTTQTVTIRNLGLNAKVIAEGHATAANGQIPASEASQAEPLIDALAAYQALLSLKPAHKQRLADVIQAELQRTDGGNGIETTLRLHRMLKQQAYDSLFQGRELHWIKGYLPEVTNPQIELAWADDQEGAELEAQGWEPVSVGYLQQDRLDRSNPRRLYRLKGRGPLRWQSGALSLTGMKAKGFTLRGETVGSGQLASTLGQQGIADMDHRARLLESQAAQQGKAAGNEAFAVPLLDDQGNVVDYRYLMTAEVRDDQLQRNNDFAQLLGNLNAQTFDKRTAVEQNRTVVQALYDHWQEAVQRGEKAFIRIGQDSPDAEGRELWALLPETSRKDIRAIWGGDFMQVPAGQYDLVAGYRKLSAASAFDKLNDWMPAHQRARLSPQARREYERDMRNLKQQLLVWLARDVFRLQGKAALRVRQFEDIWQAIVQEVKDIVVIRSGLTLFWNVVSNLTLLYWQGVPLKDMARHHWTAWRGAVNFRKDSEALFKLENELQMGVAQDPAEHRRKIRQLEDALSRNPARELIEAGMLPTIVEDVALDGDEYSYRSAAQDKLKAWTGWVPEQVRSTAATLYMAPGTVLHKGLSQATQYSDFIARYTLYQHLTQRSKAPMSHSEALERISDSFINYDVPSERQMQYLNDMGVFMFTKYYLRIQRVILQQFREKPVRGLLLVLLDNYLQGMQMIMDSGFWGRLGNPLEWGALQFPGSLDELATIGGLTALWK